MGKGGVMEDLDRKGATCPVDKAVGKMAMVVDNALQHDGKKSLWLMKSMAPSGRHNLGMWVSLMAPITVGEVNPMVVSDYLFHLGGLRWT